MKFDYSKTINEQLPTFEYYKDRYCSYELELINDRKEIERLNNIIKEQGLEDKPNYYVKGLEGSLKEYQGEVKRLNNIINEFEKWLESKTPYFRENDYDIGQWNGYVDCKNKLQELKGSVSNE